MKKHIKIISIQVIFLIAVIVAIYFLYPKTEININEDIVRFKSINANVIIISESPDFSNSRYLKINDAFRPISVQERYYKAGYKSLKRAYPNWGERKIRILLNVLIYPPAYGIPPHSTGSAIDVVLTKNLKTGRSIMMDSKKIGENTKDNIFNKKAPKHIRKNRLILYNAMTWHYRCIRIIPQCIPYCLICFCA